MIQKIFLPTMEVYQETSEVTNSSAYELIKYKMEGEKTVNPTTGMETDISESSSNAIATAAIISALPHVKEGYSVGASSSTLRARPPPAFLLKVYDMVNNPEADSVISWNSTGTSLIVWDPHKFAAEVLGKYFRHNNFSSFVCQLNTYGFKKINWERLEFQNEWFQKGKRRWLNRIKRRNQISENVQPLKVMQPSGKFTFSEMQKKLENLMHEHDALKSEMMNLIRKQESLQKEMASLEKQAEVSISKRQKILKYMLQEVLKIDGQPSIEGSVKLLDEGEISKPRQEKPSSTESDTKKACSAVNLEIASHEKEKNSTLGSIFPDLNIADYAMLEKQLMHDLNLEKLSEEERAKLQPDLGIALEDLIAGPADWTEFAKDLGNKTKNLGSKYWC